MTAGRDFQSCEEFDFFFKEKVEYHGKQVCRVVLEKNDNLLFHNILRKKNQFHGKKPKHFFSCVKLS